MSQSLMNVLIALFAISVVSAVVGQITDEPETTTEQFEATTEEYDLATMNGTEFTVYIWDTESTDDINATLADRTCHVLVKQRCNTFTCPRTICNICISGPTADSGTSTDAPVQNTTISSIDVDGVTFYVDGNDAETYIPDDDDVTSDGRCLRFPPGTFHICCGAGRTCSLCIG